MQFQFPQQGGAPGYGSAPSRRPPTRSRSEAVAAEPGSRRLSLASAPKVGEHSDPLGQPVRRVGEGLRPRPGAGWRRQGAKTRRTVPALLLRGICEVRVRGGTRAGPTRGCGDLRASGTRARGFGLCPVGGRPDPNTPGSRPTLPPQGRETSLFFLVLRKNKGKKILCTLYCFVLQTRQFSCLLGFSFFFSCIFPFLPFSFFTFPPFLF